MEPVLLSASVSSTPSARASALTLSAISLAPVIDVAPAPVATVKVPVDAAWAAVPSTAELASVSFRVSIVVTFAKSVSTISVSATVISTISDPLPPITFAAVPNVV